MLCSYWEKCEVDKFKQSRFPASGQGPRSELESQELLRYAYTTVEGICYVEAVSLQRTNRTNSGAFKFASELYRPSNLRFSAKLVPTLADREGVAWSAQRFPTAVNFGFLDRSRYFPFK
jgi:hypothetical protein